MAGEGAKDESFKELWHACAGSNLRVPEAGERVFYLPQVHLAQVKANTANDGEMPVMDNPFFKLPPKILCMVVNVQLKVEPQTDEVFALITLQPEPEQQFQASRHENFQSLPQAANVCSFVKLLTASDTSTHGLTVPKRDALKCLPHLDMSQHTPTQELIAKDILGRPWHFRHTHRGTPKRHLLTSGWSAFLTSKRLVAGDTIIFLGGENGDILVGLRRSSPQKGASASIVSGQNMQLGIFTSVCHAFQMGIVFTFRYHPWASPSDFIVPYDQYTKSLENDYSIGTRFRMQFEGEDSKKRSVGTVVGVDEIDCIRWPGSKWKCLKVQWDATSDMLVHPDRVSPWNVEPLELKEHKSIAPLLKRPRKLEPLANGFPSSAQDGLFQSSSWHLPKGVLQGQVIESMSPQESETYKVEDHLHSQCPSGSISNQGGNPANSGHSVHWVPSNISTSICNNKGREGTISLPNVNPASFSQEPVASRENYEVEKPLAKTNGSSKCRIFGCDLVCSSELPSLQAEMSVKRQNLCSFPPMTSQSGPGVNHVSDQSVNIAHKRCWSCSSSSTQNHIKVLKHDSALGRSVDLTHFNGYEELIRELDQMFEFNGKLCDASNGWQVTYQDQDGYLMRIGDLLWQNFTFAAQSLFICSQEYLESLNSKSVNAFGALLLPCYHSLSGIRQLHLSPESTKIQKNSYGNF